jgi:hypothetical protein
MEVTCLDENDSPPVFDETLKIVLSEAFLPGHRIAKVTATDKDLVRILTSSAESQRRIRTLAFEYPQVYN